MYKRVLLKLSGEALGSKGKSIDPNVLDRTAKEIKEIYDMGIEIGIVVGGGNLLRGKFAEEMHMDRCIADNIGMLGTMMNALSLKNALQNRGMKAVVMSAIEMNKIAELADSERAIKHLEDNEIVIFGCGVGNPYFSTDTCAALRAAEIKAEVILMAKNGVDGVYSADPNVDKTAVKYDILTYKEVLAKDLKVIDLTGISMCEQANMNTFVFDMNVEHNIRDAVLGTAVGTKIVKEK